MIGDMDSLSDAARRRLPPETLYRIDEQDSTDFDKSLRSVDAPMVLGIGFLGRRVDHQLANLNVLARHHDKPCVLIARRDVIFAAPRRVAMELEPGSRVSLFPMAPVRGRSRGLHWPIDGLDMTPGGRVGTSNRVATGNAGPVELEFDAPGMLVILPRAALDAAITALTPAT